MTKLKELTNTEFVKRDFRKDVANYVDANVLSNMETIYFNDAHICRMVTYYETTTFYNNIVECLCDISVCLFDKYDKAQTALMKKIVAEIK